MKFSEKDVNDIESAVGRAEQNTSGEIAPAFMDSSDFYPVAHFRSAILFGFIGAILLYLCVDIKDPIWFLWVQIPSMILGYSICYLSSIKYFFITKKEMDEEVHQRAVEVFIANGLHLTKDRNGILIFISNLERRVEILADEGVNEVVGENAWDSVIKKLVESIKNKESKKGIEKAIEECGEILKKHFPHKEDDENELSNKLIRD